MSNNFNERNLSEEERALVLKAIKMANMVFWGRDKSNVAIGRQMIKKINILNHAIQKIKSQSQYDNYSFALEIAQAYKGKNKGCQLLGCSRCPLENIAKAKLCDSPTERLLLLKRWKVEALPDNKRYIREKMVSRQVYSFTMLYHGRRKAFTELKKIKAKKAVGGLSLTGSDQSGALSITKEEGALSNAD